MPPFSNPSTPNRPSHSIPPPPGLRPLVGTPVAPPVMPQHQKGATPHSPAIASPKQPPLTPTNRRLSLSDAAEPLVKPSGPPPIPRSGPDIDQTPKPAQIPPNHSEATPPEQSSRPRRQASNMTWKQGPAKENRSEFFTANSKTRLAALDNTTTSTTPSPYPNTPWIPTIFADRISLNKALKDTEKLQLTKNAVRDEVINMFDSSKALQPVHFKDIPSNFHSNIINGHLFLTDKFTAEGIFDKRKGRFVLNGNEQPEETIGDTRSPTINPISLLMMLSKAVQLRKSKQKVILKAHDIVAAFLGTEFPKDKHLYIVIDRMLTSIIVQIFPKYASFVSSDGRMYCRVLKFIYGLAEASKQFYDKLNKTFLSMGYKASIADPCLYIKRYKEGLHMICCHVDDIFSVSPSEAVSKYFENKLGKVFELKTQAGSTLNYLGMVIKSHNNGDITVSQQAYVA